MTDTIRIGGYEPGAIGRVAELHGLYYTAHWGFGLQFEAGVAQGLGEFMLRFDELQDLFLSAWDNDRLVGSVTIDGGGFADGKAKLRFFILEAGCHGRGVGGQMMARAMAFCDEVGHRHVTLDTFEGLKAAGRLYQRHGFRITAREENSTMYGPPVTSLTYARIIEDS